MKHLTYEGVGSPLTHIVVAAPMEMPWSTRRIESAGVWNTDGALRSQSLCPDGLSIPSEPHRRPTFRVRKGQAGGRYIPTRAHRGVLYVSSLRRVTLISRAPAGPFVRAPWDWLQKMACCLLPVLSTTKVSRRACMALRLSIQGRVSG